MNELTKEEKKERDQKVKLLADKKYGGRWEIEDPEDRQKLSEHLDKISGVAKTKIQYYKKGGKYPTLEFINELYDGEYRDKVIYQKVSLNQFNFSEKDDNTTIDHQKVSTEIAYGRL